MSCIYLEKKIIEIPVFFLIILLCNFSCHNTINQNSFVKKKAGFCDARNMPKDIRKDMHYERKGITLGNLRFEIETAYLNDTLELKCVLNEEYSSPVISKQRVIFSKGQIVKNEIELPFKSVFCNNLRGERIAKQELDVWRIYAILTPIDTLLGLEASGQCMGIKCPEFTAIYTKEGKSVYQYQNNKDKYDDELLFKIFSEYQISDSLYKTAQKCSFRIN